MPITVEEKYGRRLSDKSAELTYVIRGTSDDASARAELLTESSLTHDGLQRDDVEVEEIEGLDAFIGTVRYDSRHYESRVSRWAAHAGLYPAGATR